MHCGKEHDEGKCPNPARCANCSGPHPANFPACAARPTKKNGKITRPTKKQLTHIRELGNKVYQMAHGTLATANKATGPGPKGEKPSALRPEKPSAPAPQDKPRLPVFRFPLTLSLDTVMSEEQEPTNPHSSSE